MTMAVASDASSDDRRHAHTKANSHTCSDHRKALNSRRVDAQKFSDTQNQGEDRLHDRKYTQKKWLQEAPPWRKRKRKGLTMNVPTNTKRSRDSPTRLASNKNRKGEELNMETEEEEDPLSICKTYITTEVNLKTFSIDTTLEKLGATEHHVQKAKTGFVAIQGLGQIQATLETVTRLAARVMKFKKKVFNPNEEQALKQGLLPGEWLLFFSALLNEKTMEDLKVREYISRDDEIIECLVLASQMSYTKPQVICTRITFGKTKTTNVSGCWYGAKMTLGSWYADPPKKLRSLKLKESLERAEANTQVKIVERYNHKEEDINEMEDALTDVIQDAEEQIKVNKKEKNKRTKKEVTKRPSGKEKKKRKKTNKHKKDKDSSSSSSSTSSSSSSSSNSSSSSSSSEEETEDEVEIVEDPKKAPKTDKKTDQETQGEVAQETDTGVGTKKVQQKLKSTPTDTAAMVRQRRATTARLQLMFPIKKHKKKNANQLAYDIFVVFFQGLQQEDPKAALLPWKIADWEKPALLKIAHFPDTWAGLQPYMDRVRPKNDSNCWTKICIATNLTAKNTTSLQDSLMGGWYDEYNMKCYLTVIQTSDNPRMTGAFLYSGGFINVDDLEHALVAELEATEAHLPDDKKRKWMIGLRVRKVQKLECTNERAGFLLANNSMVHVESDASQTDRVNTYLYRRFNQVEGARGQIPRPLYCNLRYLPDASLIATGSRGERDLAEMLKKHQHVVGSLKLLENNGIKQLDKPVCVDPLDEDKDLSEGAVEMTTLRKELLGLPFPLGKPNVTKKLFHSVENGSGSYNAGKVLFTAYDDRSDAAASFLRILPAWVKEMHGETAQKVWLGHQMEDMDVEFHYDDEGQWLGTWTTEDDKINQALLAENLGITICMENMGFLESDRKRRVLSADDATLKSFGMGGGGSVQTSHSAAASVESDDAASTVPAVPGDGG